MTEADSRKLAHEDAITSDRENKEHEARDKRIAEVGSCRGGR